MTIMRRVSDSLRRQGRASAAIELAMVGVLIGLRADKRNEACRDGRV